MLSSVSDSAFGDFKYLLSVMPFGLDHLNEKGQAKSLDQRNAIRERERYGLLMPPPRHDWFLREWLRTLHKKQSDIVRDLDWNKARVSLMLRGEQPYTRDAVNELAAYLNLRPHELLMHPDDAMAIRRLKADMIRLAHEGDPAPEETPLKKVSLN